MSRTASTSINGDNPKLSILGYSPDRLDFSHSNLLRREEELQRLSDIYECVQQGAEYSNSRNDKKERVSIAMIRGLSGTGKSFLAKKFLANLEKKSQEPWGPIMPFFLYGKYDDLSGADPFSALIDAFNGFANILLNGGDDELMRVRRDIRSELGSEANYLTTVVPGLRNVTGGDCDNTIGSKENASNRLKYIFQKFTNAISTAKRPVVMLLDDLQWCDLASAELIEALLTDSDLRYFMFIGTYRSDDMEADNSFFGTLQNIEKKRPVQNIKLVNLTLEEMGSFISEVLDIPKINAELLTQIVFDKTLGNIFFAKQVLEELHRNGLLEISPTSLKWEWHLDGVNLDNILSDDVIQVVTAKLQCAPFKLQRALIIAAYTRSTFDLNTLQKLLELDGHAIPSRKLMKILDKAVLDGHLINSMGSDSYSFAHDGIRQAGGCKGYISTYIHRRNYKVTLTTLLSLFLIQLITSFLQVKPEIAFGLLSDSGCTSSVKRMTERIG
jgi:predicted ATPase